jgi:outer membrane protein OmpA-like peptidoglycan-associated protein
VSVQVKDFIFVIIFLIMANITVFTQEIASVPAIPKPHKTAIKLTVPNEDELLLCSFRLNQLNMSNELVTFSTERGLFMPLGEVCRLLELGITVDPNTGSTNGFIINPRQTMLLDMASESIIISGKERKYDAKRVEAHQDDIYVESTLLADWLSMRIEADRYSSLISIHPFEKLPLEQRLAREQRGGNTWGYGLTADAGYPRIPHPYSVLAGASIDLSLQESMSSSKGKISHSEQYSSVITGDVAWMNGRAYISGNTDSGLNPIKWVLSRVNPEGGLLGKLSAREIYFGDIGSTSLPLIGGGGEGKGILISDYPLSQPNYFNLKTFQGVLPTGWDVELYRNNVLLDYRPADSGEYYDFRDIPLLYGTNSIRLVFYGPQGKKREENHTYNVGINMIPPGSRAFRFSSTEDNNKRNTSLQSTIGINNYLTLNGGIASTMLTDGVHNYAVLGTSCYLPICQIDGNIAHDLTSGGIAMDVGMLAKTGNINYSLHLTDYDHMLSLDTMSANRFPYRRKMDFRVDGIRLTRSWNMAPLSISYSHYTQTDDSPQNALVIKQSHFWKQMQFSHQLSYETTPRNISLPEKLTGTSNINVRLRNTSLHGDVQYDIIPESMLTSMSLSLDRPLPHDYFLSSGVIYNRVQKSLATTLGLHRNTGTCSIGLTAGYSSGNSWNLGVSLSSNVSSEPRTGALVSDARALASQGGISARVFLDANKNGTWDKDETLLKDVGFFVNDRSHETLTSTNGIAFLRGLTPNQPVDLSLSASTLEEMLWIPAYKGLRCLPRPGNAVALDYPLLITGEISGNVYQRDNGKLTEAAGINIEVVDAKGNVVKKTRSSFDGFYSVPNVPTGGYTIRVQPVQVQRLNVSVSSRSVVIPPSGDYIDHVDLILESVQKITNPVDTITILAAMSVMPRFNGNIPEKTNAVVPFLIARNLGINDIENNTKRSIESVIPAVVVQIKPIEKYLKILKTPFEIITNQCVEPPLPVLTAIVKQQIENNIQHMDNQLITLPEIVSTKTVELESPYLELGMSGDVKLLPRTIILPDTIHFAVDRSEISYASGEILNIVIRNLRAESSLSIVLIGHTDIRGSVEYNMALSKRRVRSVRQYLLNHGIIPGRISIEAQGKSWPIRIGNYELDHSMNRRVEMLFKSEVGVKIIHKQDINDLQK